MSPAGDIAFAGGGNAASQHRRGRTAGCVLPGIASHLLDQYPHLRVVAVTSDGRQVLVSVMRPYVEHIAVPSPADLVRAMRSLGEPDD